jgi:polyisoprenoid-binding protein YceI
MHRAPSLTAVMLLALSAFTPARAAELYHLNQSNSTIRFSVGTLGFFRARGHFAQFDATLLIDPAHPTSTRVSVTIPTASVVTPWAQESAMIRSPDFFDAARYGKIRFTSGNVTATAPDSVRQCGGNSGVAEAANGHAATVEIRGVSASMAGAMSSTIPSICI